MRAKKKGFPSLSAWGVNSCSWAVATRCLGTTAQPSASPAASRPSGTASR